MVDLGDGRTIVRRVAFPEATISGLQALQRSGLNLTTADFSFGTAVCAIEGVGCPATNCFCNATTFWGYQFWDGDDWQGYMVGASASTVGDGRGGGLGLGPRWQRSAPDYPGDPLRQRRPAVDAPSAKRQRQLGDNISGAVDVILAAAAANQRPSAWTGSGGASLVDYAAANAATFSGRSAATAGKLAVGAAAAGQDQRSFGGVNLVTVINGRYTQHRRLRGQQHGSGLVHAGAAGHGRGCAHGGRDTF